MSKQLGASSRAAWFAAVFLCLAQGAVFADSHNGEVVGEAYDLESGELLYRETHCVSQDRLERKVLYRDGDDRLIAIKKLDYRSGAMTPSFEQHNLYSSESIEVAMSDRDLTMTVRDATREAPLKTASARAGEQAPLVIDAGFDPFIRANWDSLVKGEKLEFQFPVADRTDLVQLRLRSQSCSYDSQNQQCFRLELANWLLRMLVAPVELGYDAEARQLSRYRGLSNIGDENGDGQVVDIRYDYEQVPPMACHAVEQLLTENSFRPDPRETEQRI